MGRISNDLCIQYLQDGAIPTADADISGIGVILAFIMSAYISFSVVALAYLTGFVDPELLNAVDRKVFHIRPYSHKQPRVHTTISKAILVLGDQQIVTGIAILGAGFQGLRTGRISVYHYQVVLYLAWMSSSVHLSALTILAVELRENPGLMSWRVAGMLVLLVLLLVALIPTISNDWGLQRWEGMLPGRSGWGLPAQCFWGRLWGDGVNSDSVIGFVILGISYIWKIGSLFPAAGSWYNRWIRHPLENSAIKTLLFTARWHERQPNWLRLWTFRAALATSLPVFGTLAMFSSFAASLWLSCLGLVFGTMQVVIPRNQNLWYTEGQETGWTFGQLVPLILLVQPLGTVAEHAWPGKTNRDAAADAGSSDRLPAGDQSIHEHHSPAQDLRSETLKQWLATQDKSTSSEIRPDLIALLFESKLYVLIVALINCTIIATAAVVFDEDAYSIGNDKVPKWQRTAQTVGLCIASILVIGWMLAPFSRLGMTSLNGRLTLRRRRSRFSASSTEMAQVKP